MCWQHTPAFEVNRVTHPKVSHILKDIYGIWRYRSNWKRCSGGDLWNLMKKMALFELKGPTQWPVKVKSFVERKKIFSIVLCGFMCWQNLSAFEVTESSYTSKNLQVFKGRVMSFEWSKMHRRDNCLVQWPAEVDEEDDLVCVERIKSRNACRRLM